MSDLISREEARGKFQTVTEWNGEVHRYIDEQSLDAIPSADILEHAKAIKEYCEKRNGCDGCEFDTGFFRCGFSSGDCPFEWDLPEGEKE